MHSIAKSATATPFIHTQGDDDKTPAIPGTICKGLPATGADQPHADATIQEPQGDRGETCTEKAIRKLKEVADHIRNERTEQRQATEEGRKVDGNNVTEEQEPDLDWILSVLNAEDLDPEADLEMPRTWEEARNSPDGSKWEKSYRKELDSLKEMGVWTLVL
ncbi:hypothetical protein C0995_005897 [Termitomyces sp. Mi166|nr:hypothetical protein C0995_005897 [Termitomyces sp. Mi166\